jgi:hypothetical protein
MDSVKKCITIKTLMGKSYEIYASNIAEIYFETSKQLNYELNQFRLIVSGKELAVAYPLSHSLKDNEVDIVYLTLCLDTCPLYSLWKCKNHIKKNIIDGVNKILRGEDASECERLIVENNARYNELKDLYYNDEPCINDTDPITFEPFTKSCKRFVFYEGGKKYQIEFNSIVEYVENFYNASSESLLNPYTRQEIDDPFKSDLIHIWKDNREVILKNKD